MSLFTTANVDNIDHNPSARTAKDSFHGAAVSLTHHPSTDREGIARDRVVISPESPKKKTPTDLPESYTDVQPVAVQVKKDCYVPKGCKSGKPSSDLIGEGMRSEYQWLHRVKELFEKDRLDRKTISLGQPTLLRCSPKHHNPRPLLRCYLSLMKMLIQWL